MCVHTDRGGGCLAMIELVIYLVVISNRKAEHSVEKFEEKEQDRAIK